MAETKLECWVSAEEKLKDITGKVSGTELAAIRAKMQNPEQVLCPLNKRYADLPLVCTGHEYVCRYLDRSEMACTHPEKRR